jgi:probable HAF family extracellular repeat protein
MNIADKRTPGRTAARTGLILGKFRHRALPLLSGTVAVAAAVAAAGCSALGGGSAPNVALAGHTMGATPSSTMSGSAQVINGMAGGFQVLTLNDRKDLTFNQLLGINNEGVIAGYFGSGDAGHPNKGYVLRPPFAQGNFGNENFPGSAQTQVVGLNDNGITVGFFSTMNAANAADDNNIGFWRQGGRYHAVSFPTRNNAMPSINQLLGVNDTGTAVGFYNDAKGNAHGYAYNLESRRFKMITVRGATSVTATAINNLGAAAGFYVNARGATVAFVQFHGGRTFTIAMPGASATQAFGVNDNGEIVGTYTTGTGNNAVTHGFTWMNGKFTTVNYPMASSTTINGVNDEGDIVGFYTDAKGNTDGFVGLPL